ncbi:MAG: endo-1,4-beta-xylanase [Lachnospiraceae bacterium]|nr:endo-1,4-beta-xylanase [Lachnospiraceae bacterium]
MKLKTGRILAFLLTFTMIVTSFTGGITVRAATEYVDTSEYESLAWIYRDYFKVGAACEAISHWGDTRKEIGNPTKEAVIANLFNSITCGNELKPAYNFSSTSETLFKVDRAGEEMLNWAKNNGVGMRFHVLLWHSQVNPNFFAVDFKATSKGVPTTSDTAELDEDCLVDRETLVDRLRTYIYGAMEYLYSNGFAGTVYAMDVVNEAVDEAKDDGLRRSYWYKIIGPEFLYYAFLFAREAEIKYSKQYAADYGLDPDGDLSSIRPKLFYNDYNEWFTKRVNVITDFVTNRPWNAGQQMIKSDIIPADGDGTIKGDGLIDGIGMQGHLSDNNNIDEYMRALRAYSEIVDEVHITELDVGVTRTGENRWYYQAKFYYDFFAALIEEVKNGAKLTSVTFWGLTDDSSWRDGAYPLLFTYNLTAKAAFYAVAMAGKGEEFNMNLAQTLTEFKDINVDFEPYTDEATGAKTNYTVASAGFMARGTGHMPTLRLLSHNNHTEGAKVGYCLVCERNEQDATCMIDIAKFSGKNITFTAYVKTEDSELAIGLDTGTSTELKRITPGDDWAPVSINFDVPDNLNSAFVYFETNGSSDIFIDDVSIIYTKEGEEPAPVVGEEPVEISEDNNDEETPSTSESEPSVTPTPTTADTDTVSENSNTTKYIAIGLIILGALLLGYAGVLIAVNKKK